jgi:hypothetical protein
MHILTIQQFSLKFSSQKCSNLLEKYFRMSHFSSQLEKLIISERKKLSGNEIYDFVII